MYSKGRNPLNSDNKGDQPADYSTNMYEKPFREGILLTWNPIICAKHKVHPEKCECPGHAHPFCHVQGQLIYFSFSEGEASPPAVYDPPFRHKR